MSSTPEEGTALILVDVQRDFVDGSLAVPGAVSILPLLNHLIEAYAWDMIVATQDYHPKDHISFASVHDATPFQPLSVPHPYEKDVTLSQMMWPVHCVGGTPGAEIDARIQPALAACQARGIPVHYVHKGQDANIDSYSGFASNLYLAFTELASVLYRHTPHIKTLVLCGLATDYCVQATAIDAVKFGFRTFLVESCAKGVDPATTEKALSTMKAYGVITVPDTAKLTSIIQKQ